MRPRWMVHNYGNRKEKGSHNYKRADTMWIDVELGPVKFDPSIRGPYKRPLLYWVVSWLLMTFSRGWRFQDGRDTNVGKASSQKRIWERLP